MSPTPSLTAERSHSHVMGGLSGPISPATAQRARRGGLAIGAMFFAIFGALWLLIAYQLAHGQTWAPIAVVLVVALLLFGSALRVVWARRGAMHALRDTPESQRMRRQFRTINTVQWIAVVAVVLVLHRFALGAWIVPAIMLVVGLHFLPLGRVFRYRPHGLTGAVLIATAVVYPYASAAGPAAPIGSVIAGITLWLAALWSLRPAKP